jgi:DTW domain-containing protein YfiP
LLFPNQSSKTLERVNNLKKVDALIILDGTWDKAKRIFLKSQTLQNLPAAKLNSHYSTNYKIRKSNFENGVSSIEAIAFALSELEENISIDDALKPFHYFVEQQVLRQKKGSE